MGFTLLMATEGFQRVLVRVLLLDQFQGAINDALCNRLFATFHDHVHEFGQLYIAELGIRQDFTFGDLATRDTAPKILVRKRRAYLALGFLAPYLERDCLRSFTPCKSSEPRTMW